MLDVEYLYKFLQVNCSNGAGRRTLLGPDEIKQRHCDWNSFSLQWGVSTTWLLSIQRYLSSRRHLRARVCRRSYWWPAGARSAPAGTVAPTCLAHRCRRSRKSQAAAASPGRAGTAPLPAACASAWGGAIRTAMVTCCCYQHVGGDAGCLGGAPGPPSLAHHVLSRGDSEINLRSSLVVLA